METVILCGGFGTRLSEETQARPKPMVDIGDRPILWHIMRIYASYGFSDFTLALGYKAETIKDYFLHYHAHNRDLSVDLATGETTLLGEQHRDDWRVRMVDTGLQTMTGGRVRRLAPYLRGGTFMLTYGDAVAQIDVRALVDFHRKHGRYATVTAVRPSARFGALTFDGDRVTDFKEKPQTSEGWINGGFFVFEPEVLDYIGGDDTVLEEQPLERLAADDQLRAFRLESYWHCMDTVRDRFALNEEWARGSAPWKTW